MRLRPSLISIITTVCVIAIVAGVSYWSYLMPWTDEQRWLLIASTIAFIFFTLTIKLSASTVLALRHTQQEFIADQELFAELYQNSPVPYIRAKANGTIIDVNSAALRLYGETKEQLVGRNAFDAITGETNEAGHISRIPSLVASGSFINDQEAILTRFDREIRWVLLSAFPYAGKSETLLTLVDITKQKNIDTAKTEFVSLASHQLRTPISSIKWNMELLASPLIGSLNEKQQQYAEKVTRSAERMGLLINDFLDASQLEMGTFETEPGHIVLSKFLQDQLEEFEVRVAKKDLTIKTDFQPETLEMDVDEHLLRMTVNNLASNAIKYTPEGGTVNISYAVADNKVHITISDTGMGIPEEDQEKLFGKFFRASNTRDTLIEGTGIGLYIVRQAVKKMNGTMAFGSKVGVGTKFVVSLPLSE